MTIRLLAGHIRGGAIRFVAQADDLTPRSLDVTFNGAQDLPSITLRWPEDFAPCDGQAREAVIPTPTEPFSDLRISCDGADLPTGDQWWLKGLFAFSEAQFEKHLYRHRNRIKDPETLIFSTRQLLDHYTLNPAHRCVTAVVYGYRAADSCDPAFMRDARDRLLVELAATDTLSVTGEARSDRDHLHLSMTMILWHLELGLGLFDEMLATLDRAVAYAWKLPAPMAAIAYNMCRMAFLRAWLHAKAGHHEAANALFMENFHFYTKCMERAEPSAIRFTEMLDAHQAVALSLQTREKMLAGKKTMDTLTALQHINRVRSAAGVALLTSQFQKLARRNQKPRT